MNKTDWEFPAIIAAVALLFVGTAFAGALRADKDVRAYEACIASHTVQECSEVAP